MFANMRFSHVFGTFVITSIVLAACGTTATPETITETVIETVVVTEIIMEAGEVVEKEVVLVVTATPEPVEEGERTLVICQGQEPDTLYIRRTVMVAADQILQAIYDGPIDERSFAYQPVILEKLPNIADGDAVIQAVPVVTGDKITDANGEIAELADGVLVKPAGCTSMDCAVEYVGGELQMDQLEVTFKLLPGITWSDGTPLSAYDSVYSFELNKDPDTQGLLYTINRTDSYNAIDEVTIQWIGVPGFMDSLYFTNFWDPLPEHVFGQYTAAELLEEEDSNRLPVGWGAYIIDEWVQGDHITLHKNPNYWRALEGLPKFDTLIYRFVGSNSNANIASLLAGECDIVDQTSQLGDQSELLLDLTDAGQLNATFVTGTAWEHADFNIQPLGEGYFAAWDTDGDGLGPFGDVRLRRAIAMCMDRQAVIDTVMFGQSELIHAYLPRVHPLFNPEVAQWPFDIEAGSALLEEIGWVDDDGDPLTPRIASGVKGVPDGTPLAFNYETTAAAQRQQATQILAESAALCGIQMILIYYPAAEWFANPPEGKLFGRRYDLGQFAFATGVDPPCDLWLGGNQIPAEENNWDGANVTGWDNPDYNAVCNTALVTLTGQEGYEDYHLEAQRIFAEEIPVVPLYLRLKIAATRADMCNFIMDSTENSEMWNIEAFDYGECAE